MLKSKMNISYTKRMWREIEVIQIIGKRLIIHNDDHENEKMAHWQATMCKPIV